MVVGSVEMSYMARPYPYPLSPGSGQALSLSPLPPGEAQALSLSPLPPGEAQALSLSPLPPGEGQGEGLTTYCMERPQAVTDSGHE